MSLIARTSAAKLSTRGAGAAVGSLPLELRFALLEKRVGALDMVLRGEAVPLRVGLVLEGLLEGGGKRAVHGALGKPDRLGGLGGKRPHDAFHEGVELGRGQGAVDEPDALRLARPHALTEEQHLLRLMQPDA